MTGFPCGCRKGDEQTDRQTPDPGRLSDNLELGVWTLDGAEPNPEGFPPPLHSFPSSMASAPDKEKESFKVENDRRLYASIQGALDKDFI